ncbi:MAG: NrfD/PsrC family molybdoenzyme membrane anchor subunit [Anaerolineales bacterium]|nr:NrfD/PsrC family molybdoenzyme membrane anchor subunit [Anaerolineales bacterium]
MNEAWHPKNDGEEVVLSPIHAITNSDLWLWSILAAILLAGIVSWGIQFFVTGLAATGLNRPVYWGLYITNFVFFIGLAHSGTFISAILRLAGQGWRKPLTRAAEAITLFSLPFGVTSILIDMGRPDRALNIFIYGRFQSPLLWDITAVSLYLFSSVVFFYLSLIPDIALCRDRLTEVPAWQHRMYEILALGWTGKNSQFERLEKGLDGMAIFMTMLVITVHTVVSWVFGMTIQPGWHTALIGPFFLLGAIFSGTSAVVIVLAILRKTYHMENVLPISLFNSLRKLLITFTLGWLYMMIAENLTTSYGNLQEEMRVLGQKTGGDFAIMFWAMWILVFFVPLLIFIFKGKDSIPWMVGATVMVNIGMWMERFLVIVPTETRPRLLYELTKGVYHPTLIEWVITASLFSGLILLYAMFTRFFPIIPLWETADSLEAGENEQPSRGFHRHKFGETVATLKGK